MTIHRRVVMTAAAVLAAAAAGGGIAVAQSGLAARAGHGSARFVIHEKQCPTGAGLRRWQRRHPHAQCVSTVRIHSRKADVDPSSADRGGDRRSEGAGRDRASEGEGGVECEHPNVEAREERIGSHDGDRDDDCLGDNEAKEEQAPEEEAPAPATAAANFAG